MYIVKQNISGRDYFYIRKAERTGSKVRSKLVCYGGKTREDAERRLGELVGGERSVGAEKKDVSVEELAMFCKRKGFVYPSGEIYGGFAGFWDFGHLGVEMKNNLKNDWWNFHVRQREDVVGIDGSIITNPRVWEASGHVDSFSDVLVVCKKCKKPDKVDKNEIKKVKCVNCGGEFDWENLKDIKQMFEISVGVDGKSYLRPETAQLIFANFKFVQENARMKLPFGIAQIGKAFRNEIAPRDFLFRLREFEQMEIEYFVDPDEKCCYEVGDSEVLVFSEEMQVDGKEAVKMKFRDAQKKGIIKTVWHAYWLEQEFLWFTSLGADPDGFRIRQHISDEKSHYALDTWDLEYKFPFGWKELQGMANRTDYDLAQHQKFSKSSMEIMNKDEKKILPHVVCEPSQGVERAFLVFLFDSYCYDEKRKNVVLKLHPRLSPVKAAIFPIVKGEEYEKVSQSIFDDLKKDWNVVYDKSGSIGRRYSRNDEIGTPMCITVDGDTLKDESVTVRDRDTTEQVRVKIKDLGKVVRDVVGGKGVLKFGKVVETRKK
ncbi:glycine--tRNA ligase [Candidatus Pacearchaeota archaeon]|nr:glycine--tRNA ligase [Candidatus Pacearchaeota archaeon]|tara:strand:+ start:3721 stop:5352 length:1632 start_codon:yes stop_codon:yes gene_type:complete